jgi:hypothetical protein
MSSYQSKGKSSAQHTGSDFYFDCNLSVRKTRSRSKASASQRSRGKSGGN